MNRNRQTAPLPGRGTVRPRPRSAPGRPLGATGLTWEAQKALLGQVLGFLALYALVVNYIIGTLAAVTFLATTAGVVALGPRDALTGLLRVSPLLALPLLALVSAQWSEAPGTTTRAGLQLLLTAGAAAVLGARCRERTVVLALFLGLLTLCATAIPQIPEGLSSGYPILGGFGSKNALGIHCQFLEVFALAVAADRTHGWPMRLFAFFALLLSLLLVYLARSGGAAVLAGVTLLVFPAFLLFGRLPIRARIGGLVATFVVLLGAVILAPQIVALINWFRTDVLGKDATLTGRTELWEIADRQVSEAPWLGHGYFAFWRVGNPEAEAIWRNFGVGRGGGFNFHNEFVEFSVGLGYVGVGLLIALCLIVAVAASVRHILRPSVQSAVTLTAMVSIYARAFVETGLVAPFSAVLAYWLIIGSRSFSEVWSELFKVRPGRSPRPDWLRGQSVGITRNAVPVQRGRSPVMMPERD